MPKSKKPRKKYTPKPKVRVINKEPHCKHCFRTCRLATNYELADFKAHDPTFKMDFLFLPQCECWEKHDDWMEL